RTTPAKYMYPVRSGSNHGYKYLPFSIRFPVQLHRRSRNIIAPSQQPSFLPVASWLVPSRRRGKVKPTKTWTRFHLPLKQKWPTWSVDHDDMHVGPLTGLPIRNVSLGRTVENPEQAANMIVVPVLGGVVLCADRGLLDRGEKNASWQAGARPAVEKGEGASARGREGPYFATPHLTWRHAGAGRDISSRPAGEGVVVPACGAIDAAGYGLGTGALENSRHSAVPPPWARDESRGCGLAPPDDKKKDDVPVELWGVGAWCDGMPEPEEYKKPKKPAQPRD
ncbi:hypothetical protein PG985_011604, partial [Apiospora marii]|uniref:uncharacterized protein n=1 Tax=Apiospora marii TaxID=335849 RepID=UPI00312F1802